MFSRAIHQPSWFCTILLAAAPLLAQETDHKLPVPDAAAQAESMKLVKEIYGREYAGAKKAEQKQALAKKLLQKACETQNEPTSKYVLLKLAKNIATQAVDVETALAAVDAMAQSFEVDPLEIKADVLSEISKKARLASEHKAVAEQSFALIDQAVTRDKYDLAAQLGASAMTEARLARALQLLQQIKNRVAETEVRAQAYEEMKKAASILEQKPTDPEANLAVGKYYCFTKGDWDKGVSMLALGSDSQLKGVAAKELEGATTATAQLALADQWWELAETQEDTLKKALQDHAASWYRKALPELSGLAQDKAQKRIDLAGPGVVSAPAPAEQPAKTTHKPGLKKTARIGGGGGGYFDEGNASAMLIGVSVTTRNFAGHNVIGSVQALYQSGRNKVSGKVHGSPNGKPVVFVAKPGFAVAGIIAIGGDRLDGFRVVFMRVKGRKLDPTQTYQSDWIGGGNDGTRLGCDGDPVVGIFGGAGTEVDGLGLIQLE